MIRSYDDDWGGPAVLGTGELPGKLKARSPRRTPGAIIQHREALGRRSVQGVAEVRRERRTARLRVQYRNGFAFVRWAHDQSISKVQSGSARPMIDDDASAPK